MQKGFGIAALVIAIVAIFIPIVGPWVTILAAGLAAFSYGDGFPLAIGAIAINIVNIIFLTPSLWVAQAVMSIGGAAAHQSVPFMPYLFLGAQVAAIISVILLHRRTKTNGRSVS